MERRLQLATTVAFLLLCLVGIALGVKALVSSTPLAARVAAARPPAAAGRSGARPTPPPLPAEPVSIQGAMIHGSEQAKIALVEYTEFKCPYCGVFARDTLPALKQKYVDTGKVLLVFRHFPLDSLHPFARQAAQGAECAGRQGKFWQLHDLMFANQSALEAIRLAEHVKALGLDTTGFGACMNGDSSKRIQDDVTSGQVLGVTGTPTFFIGILQSGDRLKLVERLAGAQPLAPFEAALDRWLEQGAKGTR